MLERLVIKNIALIDSADIVFGAGLNILSGETGSGKSVILDSLNFVLGSKADKNMIRYGETEAYVRGEFTVAPQSAAVKALEELDIESDGEIIITRKYSADGKGNIKINGNTVTAGMLKTVSQHLVDVYGQSEHFALLSEANQLSVIDGLCGERAADIKNALSIFISEKRECLRRLKQLGGDSAERARRLDLLSYQIKEIDSAELKDGEEEELIAKRRIIDNTEKIASAVSGSLGAINGDGGGSDGISAARRLMANVSEYGDDYSSVSDRLDAVLAELQDIADTLSDMADGLEFDEADARRVEDRLDLIRNLKKKYGATVDEILAFRAKAGEEFDLLSDSEAVAEKLTKRLEELDESIFGECVKLTELRKNNAENFCRDVESELKSLNISGARFEVRFDEYDKSSANLTSVNGSDKVKFMFSANKGEPLKPLNKVISGGELSRFMLAIKTCLKDLNGISTYIFDEIDAGISGITARSVAEKFTDIAKNTQIIAVSHLPQICAAGDRNFLISKAEQNGGTVTSVREIVGDAKIAEIIRLTGGGETEAARQHAAELIAQYK
ncbi:MAG TPA: DNA repair protein RecN [Candidatus Coproplasma stercoripullorum]|uniref:DNA repair protein RecN n=1 Tax=Candidatus Coproplasma stercoripullorum TaxID=2840751 RepID=A0A9D1AFP6_9FIRM|nr:DNA repair protein RecN [Candidatus Coproplasma stercoripullorum]